MTPWYIFFFSKWQYFCISILKITLSSHVLLTERTSGICNRSKGVIYRNYKPDFSLLPENTNIKCGLESVMTVPSVTGDVRSDIVWSVLSGKLYAKGWLSVAVWDYLRHGVTKCEHLNWWGKAHAVSVIKVRLKSGGRDQTAIIVEDKKRQRRNWTGAFALVCWVKRRKNIPGSRGSIQTINGLAHVCICTHLISTHSLMKRPQTINTQDHFICNENTEIEGWSAL